MQNPLISIITPLFNKELYISETIQSVRNQSYSNWEHIIIDDHSTDKSYNIALALSHLDSRIVLKKRRNPLKSGQVCRNEGILLATGTYLIFLDADDCLAPFCLKERIKFLQRNPLLDFAVFPQQIFYQKPGDNEYLINKWESEFDDLTRFLKFIYDIDVPWLPTSPIWKKESLTTNKIHWDTSLSVYQDIDFHITALLSGLKYTNVETKPDCFWRRGVGENIGSTTKELKSLCNINFMLQNILLSIVNKGLLTPHRKKIIIKNLQYLIINFIFHEMNDQVNITKRILSDIEVGFWNNTFLCFFEKTMKLYRFHPQTKQLLKKIASFVILNKYKQLLKKTPHGFLKIKYKEESRQIQE